MQKVANHQEAIIEIELEDIREFFDQAKDHGFVERVRVNTYRYVQIFSKVIDEHMPQPSINIPEDSLSASEITMQQRRFNAQNAHQAQLAQGLIKSVEN